MQFRILNNKKNRGLYTTSRELQIARLLTLMDEVCIAHTE
jgi:hypothetical protein